MAKAKAEALELIKQLPDDVTTAVILEELFFKQQVEKGLQDVAEGGVLTQQEMKERIARWRQSAGAPIPAILCTA
jgi:predicted transcriptional regulator